MENEEQQKAINKFLLNKEVVKKPKKLLCCICKKVIKKDKNNWEYGNNAEPIKKGRCCDFCNSNIVIPTRIYKIYNSCLNNKKINEDKK